MDDGGDLLEAVQCGSCRIDDWLRLESQPDEGRDHCGEHAHVPRGEICDRASSPRLSMERALDQYQRVDHGGHQAHGCRCREGWMVTEGAEQDQKFAHEIAEPREPQ